MLVHAVQHSFPLFHKENQRRSVVNAPVRESVGSGFEPRATHKHKVYSFVPDIREPEQLDKAVRHGLTSSTCSRSTAECSATFSGDLVRSAMSRTQSHGHTTAGSEQPIGR